VHGGRCLGLAAALALACGDEPPAADAARPPVMVQRAASEKVLDRIEASGQVLARAEAAVAAQVSGEVTGVAVDEGGAVEAGQVVIEIDPAKRRLEVANARAHLVRAEAEVARAERDAGRIETLAAKGVTSQARLDEVRTQADMARSALASARAELGLAERALADASVAAPFAGLVARRHVNRGEFVNAGSQLFDLVALDPVEVEFHLAEAASSRAALGQQVEVRVASHPDQVFRAEVHVVSPTIDPATRTRRVKALLPNPDGRLLPGTFARVDLGVAEREGVVMVPKEALLQRADGSVLFRLAAPDRVERLKVETGIFQGDLVEVRGSVAAGDWIVVRGQTALVDGSPVALHDEKGEPVDPTALGLPAQPQPGGEG
jgi:RND family efflux transporter MFP subunit